MKGRKGKNPPHLCISFQIYQKHKTHFSVETNRVEELVSTAAGNIERLLESRSKALKVRRLVLPN